MVTSTQAQKETESIPSVKDLASSESSVRRKSIQQIVSHLETRSPSNHLTHTQALQLWRGFHVALYMHDSKNQLSVQTLIATLASTFEIIRAKDRRLASNSKPSHSATPEEATTQAGDEAEDDFAGFDDEPASTLELSSSWMANYSTAFWETIAREWSSVDQWRMNKYLLLTRLALRQIFSICLSSYFGVEPDSPTQQQPDQQDQDQATEPKTKKRKGGESNTDKSPQPKKPKTSPSSSSATTTTSSSTSTQDQTPLKSQLHILSTHPLSPRSRQTSDGLRLHMLDIYLDELMHAATTLKSAHGESIDASSLRDVLRTEFTAPVQGVAADGLARHVRTRAKEVLGEFEERLAEIL